MIQADEAIYGWVKQDVHGRNMLNLAQNSRIDLYFSLISSIGYAVRPGELLHNGLQPRRVLDPYFWALELQNA